MADEEAATPAGEAPPAEDAADTTGALAVASPFKSIVVQDVTPQEVDMLWEQLGFNTKPDELLQYNRQHNLLIESALTALAKNTKKLNEGSKKASEDAASQQKQIDKNSEALAKIAAESDDDSTGATLRELMKQFAEFKTESGRQMSLLSAELAGQKEENGKLRGDLARLGPLLDEVANLSQQVAGVQRDVNSAKAAAQHAVNSAKAAANAPVDFTPVWEECEALRNRLLDVENASLEHREQLETAMGDLAANGAADDVLANLDFDDLAALGTDGIDENSDIFKSVKLQTMAVGAAHLELISQVGGLFALETFDLKSCFKKWRAIVNMSPRRDHYSSPPSSVPQSAAAQASTFSAGAPQSAGAAGQQQSAGAPVAQQSSGAAGQQQSAGAPGAPQSTDAQSVPNQAATESGNTSSAAAAAQSGRAATPPIQGMPTNAGPATSQPGAGQSRPMSRPVTVPVSPPPSPGRSIDGLPQHYHHHHDEQHVLQKDPAREKEKKKAGIEKAVEGKIGRKMEERLEQLKLMADMKQLKEMVKSMKAELDETDLAGLRSDMERMGGQLGAVELAAKAAAAAAKEASDKAEAVAAEAAAGPKMPEGMDQMMESVQKLEGMQTALSEMEAALALAMGWQEECESLRLKVEPVPSLQQAVWDVKQELPKKVDEVDLGKLQMQMEQLQKGMDEMGQNRPGAGLGADVEAALMQLSKMDLRGILSEHAQKLAELFNKKASLDDISNAMESMKDLDAKMAAEIEGRASAIMGEFNQTRDDWNQNLSQLGTAINSKADEVWLKSLEEQIREEMERLRKKTGGKGISKKELDAKLAELRAKLAAAGGLQETGSAVFRCIACARPLPDTGPQGPPGTEPRPSTTGPQFGGTVERKGRKFKDNDADVIMKGGFPMLNPKTKGNRKMTPEEQSRMFGKNLATDAIASQAAPGDPRHGVLPPMADRPLPDPGAQGTVHRRPPRGDRVSGELKISPRSASVPPPSTPPRPGSVESSLPHFDNYGQFAGGDRQIQTTETGVRNSTSANFPV